MAGTKIGGKKAYQKTVERFGEDFIVERSRKGGQVKTKKGFALLSKERLREVSKRGGTISRPPVRTPRPSAENKWY